MKIGDVFKTDPNDLKIHPLANKYWGEVSQSKLKQMRDTWTHQRQPVEVVTGEDGDLYIVNGRHRQIITIEKGINIECILVSSDNIEDEILLGEGLNKNKSYDARAMSAALRFNASKQQVDAIMLDTSIGGINKRKKEAAKVRRSKKECALMVGITSTNKIGRCIDIIEEAPMFIELILNGKHSIISAEAEIARIGNRGNNEDDDESEYTKWKRTLSAESQEIVGRISREIHRKNIDFSIPVIQELLIKELELKSLKHDLVDISTKFDIVMSSILGEKGLTEDFDTSKLEFSV